MNQTITKQMLCLSLHSKNESGYIRFEIEPFYADKKRLPDLAKDIDVCDTQILLRNSVFKEGLAFSILLSLFCRSSAEDKERDMAQLIYPHIYEGNTVLLTDAEKYEFKPHRQFLEELPLPSLNEDQVYDDESFKQTLAERILTHLPISEELCHAEDEEQKHYSRPQ